MREPLTMAGARRLPLAAALALLLGACAGAPVYHSPVAEPALPARFAGTTPDATGAAAPAAAPAAGDLAHFWHGFGDATLDGLVQQALAANGDLKLAEARLRESRSNLDLAEVDNLPSLSLQGDATRAVSPLYLYPGTSRSERTYTAYDLGFVANWELDLFGRVASERAAAAAQDQAGVAGLQGARLSVVAEVARNYLLLRGTQERLEVTRRALDNQRASLDIVQARSDAGRATELDLQRALALVQSTEAQLPALAIVADQAILRLATLTATAPASLLERLRVAAPLPGLPATDLSALPVGTPEQWLARRPDLVAAERQVAAATAEVGVSRAELYPHISLGGLLGLASPSLSGLGHNDALRYSVGPTLSWNAFDFGRVRARVRGSQARVDQALASWQQSVRLALEETEGAFSAFSHGNQRSARLAQAAEHADAAAGLARLRYEAGVTDFLAVLDAERDALSTRDQLTQARTDTAAALVAVYRTLGGGWEVTASN